MIWSKEYLHKFIKEKLKDRLFIVVANREPYMHVFKEGHIECIRPTGGLIAALDPVMKASNGIWVASGTGSADKKVVDKDGKIRVPPDKAEYTLKRVWLTKQQEANYYYGFSCDTLWPLCHIVYVRPTFNTDYWESYKQVNQIFANVVLKEIKGKKAFVWIHDYHFALLPKIIKEARPDVNVAHFWHIPWPNPEVFRIFPWKKEILEGLLGNDILGFHTHNYCNNFIQTVSEELEVRVDKSRSCVYYSKFLEGNYTRVEAYPVSIDYEEVSHDSNSREVKKALKKIKERLRLTSPFVSLGLDRLDYTKGIPERIKAVDRLFEKHPELKEKIQHIEAGVLSRIYLDRYRELNDEIQDMADKVNWKHSTEDWAPIVVLKDYKTVHEVLALYQLSDLCIVSSLHDGLNLVAKEYIASKGNLRGAVVLSEFTGAARELEEALIVNPYDRESFADTIYNAYKMDKAEVSRRMEKLRKVVSENNIYKWAGQMVSALIKGQ